MNKLEEYNQFFRQYDINIVKEFFYILFNCVDKSIDTYEQLAKFLQNNPNYEQIKDKYKEFYNYVINYFESLDISKDMFVYTQLHSLINTLMSLDEEYIKKKIYVILSDILDLIFIKYAIKITDVIVSEDVKEYLMNKINDKDIVDLLNVLLLSNNSLEMGYLKKVSHEDLENILRTIMLISLHICKKDENERNSKTNS